MKPRYLALAILLASGLAAWAQDQPQAKAPETPTQQKPAQKPTLGPAPAPSLYGPRTSSTTDARKLMRVRKIYVERIDNSLDEKLIEGLSKTRRFHIVANRREADAVLRGTCFDSRRLKAVRSEVYLNDTGGASIWQDSVRRPYNPPPLEAAVRETATLILTHLSESLMEAEHK